MQHGAKTTLFFEAHAMQTDVPKAVVTSCANGDSRSQKMLRVSLTYQYITCHVNIDHFNAIQSRNKICNYRQRFSRAGITTPVGPY